MLIFYYTFSTSDIGYCPFNKNIPTSLFFLFSYKSKNNLKYCFTVSGEKKPKKQQTRAREVMFTMLLTITLQIVLILESIYNSGQKMSRTCIYFLSYPSPRKAHSVFNPTQLKSLYTSINSICRNIKTAIKKIKIQRFVMPVIRGKYFSSFLPDTPGMIIPGTV